MIAMPRGSWRALSEHADASLGKTLAKFLKQPRSEAAWETFARQFFTRGERRVFVRRFQVAARLLAGQSYRRIQDELHVSPNLIRRMDRWLETEQPGYRRLASIRHRSSRRRVARGRREQDRSLGSLEAFLGRFPL